MKRRLMVWAAPAVLLAAGVRDARGQARAPHPAPAPATPLQPGQTLAWPEVTLLDGSRFNASPAANGSHAAVVVFWSTTCPFCRNHNRHVEKLYRAAAGQGLAVLGVARETDAAAVQRYARQQGYSFPITVHHPGLAAVLAPRRVIPLTVTLDRQGRLKQVIAGEMFEEDVMQLLQLAQTEARS
jgi:thiol-disulfide isomerase/thioredoxin